MLQVLLLAISGVVQIQPFVMSLSAITLTRHAESKERLVSSGGVPFAVSFLVPCNTHQLDFPGTASRVTMTAGCHLHTTAHLPSRSAHCWYTPLCFWLSKNAKTETTAARNSSWRQHGRLCVFFNDADRCQDNMASVVDKWVTGWMSVEQWWNDTDRDSCPSANRPPELSQRDWTGIETGLPWWEVGDEPPEPRHGPRVRVSAPH